MSRSSPFGFRSLPLLVFLLALILIYIACRPSDGASPPSIPTIAPTRAVAFNEMPAKMLPPKPRAYAALGASETYGFGATPLSNGYAYVVSRQLHARPFVNVGIPGAPLHLAYDTELSNALAIRPALCTVFFGYNDVVSQVSRDSFLRDLHDLVVTLHQERCKVLVIDMPDLALLPKVRALHLPGVRKITTSWNSGMHQVARQTGSSFLDLQGFSRELMAHPAYIGPDGLHPSNKGYARLAQVVLAAIRRDHLWPTQ